ncbi:MAG TPA: hypothetical protein VK034_14555, partial [Enhygromyxa sp.]|nr:hypothetical protein [Enhygromyxa sp.]
MGTPEDSLVAPARGSPIKLVLATVTVVAIAAAAWWTFGRGKGQPEDPARVLIIGPTPELAEWLEREGFDVDHLSFGAAVGEGQAFDAGLDDLPAILEYADQTGIGYIALSMAHGERYQLAASDYPADDPDDPDDPPDGTTFAVVSVGDLGRHLSYGGVAPGVVHEHPIDERIGLLLALFGQPELAKARSNQARNDLMIRFGSARTLAHVIELEKAQESMRREAAAWTALTEKERGDPRP